MAQLSLTRRCHAGRGPPSVSFEGVDTMSLTAHKFYGLNGIGLLLKRRKLALEPLIHGGESTTYLSQRHAYRRPWRPAKPPLRSCLRVPPGNQRKRIAFLRDALSKYPKVHINSRRTRSPTS